MKKTFYFKNSERDNILSYNTDAFGGSYNLEWINRAFFKLQIDETDDQEKFLVWYKLKWGNTPATNLMDVVKDRQPNPIYGEYKRI